MGYSVFLHGFARADAEHTVYETLALLAATALVGPWILGQVRDGRLVRVTRVFATMAFFFTAIVAIVNGVAPGSTPDYRSQRLGEPNSSRSAGVA